MATERQGRSGNSNDGTLLWEALRPPGGEAAEASGGLDCAQPRRPRLPHDHRCVAQTRSGRRCRGRARAGTEFCVFHDPSVTDETRRAIAQKAAQARRARPTLPKGYPRRLTTPESARAALERLYLETRTGLVTPQQASALLWIINRLINSQTSPGVRSTVGVGHAVPPAGRAMHKSYRPALDHDHYGENN